MAKRENIIRAYERAVEQLFSNKAAFADYLDFSGRFYKLPSSQTIMIYDDNPNAKMVADYDTWQQFGRRVKPGGWSTDVLDNGKIRRLFDISMTRGEKIPYQWSLNKKTAEEFTERLSKSENQNFTGMSDCIYHLAANAVSERFEDVANLLDISEKDEELFRRSFSSMVRRVIAARCEWNSEFTYGGTGAAKGVDLSALDFLDNSGDLETLLEEVQITAKNVLKSMEKSINDIIFERSIDNERNERVDRTRDNDIGRGSTSSVVRGGEVIYAVDNDAQREDVQARREDVPVQPDDGIIADERGTGADEYPDKPLGESLADVYDGELPGGYSEAAGQTSVGSDTAQNRQGSVGDHGENKGGVSINEPAPNIGERVGLGGTAESTDRGTDNGVSGERSEDGTVTPQSNENTLTAENSSAVIYLSLRIAELSDALAQKYDGDFKDFTLANYAFSHTGAEYDLNLSVRENAEKMLHNSQHNYLKDYLNTIFKEAFEGHVIVDEGITAGEIISQLSKLRSPKTEKMSAHSEDGEQLRLFPEPLDKKQQAELEKLTAELTDEFASWEKHFLDGGSDAIYEDGVGLALIRNHILHYKYELEEKFPNNLPEIYHRETPPEYPNNYQSVKKGDTLRFEYGDYLVLSIEKTNEYSGEYTVQLQDKDGEVITQNLRDIKTKFQNLTNRGEALSLVNDGNTIFDWSKYVALGAHSSYDRIIREKNTKIDTNVKISLLPKTEDLTDYTLEIGIKPCTENNQLYFAIEYNLHNEKTEEITEVGSYFIDTDDVSIAGHSGHLPNYETFRTMVEVKAAKAVYKIREKLKQESEPRLSIVDRGAEIKAKEVVVGYDGGNVYWAASDTGKELEPSAFGYGTSIEESLKLTAENNPDYAAYINDNFDRLVNDMHSELDLAARNARAVEHDRLVAEMASGGYGDDEANSRAQKRIAELKVDEKPDIPNIPFDLDKFYVNRENERVTRVYYNPDSDAGGQLVYEHFTFDQIFDAMIKEDALEYLTEVCRQELADVTAPDFAAKAREFLADTEDFNSRDEGYLDKLGALTEPTFSIMQLKDGENLRDYRFEGMAELRERGLYIDRENYNRVYRGRLNDGETLEDIYTRFNVDRPKDFYGHSLSVGDIIGIVRDGKPTAYYVDSAGFEEVPDFLLDLDERRARRTLTDNIGLYAENQLASDEMDHLGDYLFDPDCTYDHSDLTIGEANFPFDELRKLAERYKNGEDIRAELGHGMYVPRGEISYYGKYGYDFPNPKITVTRDENGMNFKTKGGFEITYSWEQLGKAMITAARNEYDRHEKLDRAAEITDIIEEVRKGKTAVITEKSEEQSAMVENARKKTFDNITLKFDNDRGFHLTADTANEHGAVITIFGQNEQMMREYLDQNAEQIALTEPAVVRSEKKMTTDEFMADFVPYNEKKLITAERVGDFYEFYGETAKELSEKFNLTLTQRNGEPMVGVPAYSFEDFCDEIFDKGYMVENDPAYQENVKPHVTVSPSRARAEELINAYCEREFGDEGDFSNPARVGLAYTDDEQTGLPKEVYADLDGCRIVTTFNNVVVAEEKFKSLDEMNVALDNLSFDDLVFLTEEQRINGIKKTFDGLKVGDMVRGDGEVWRITKITGDFSVNYDNVDPNAQTSSQSIYGGWKELFAQRGFVRVSSEELERTSEKSQAFPTITCELSENSAFEDGKTYTIAEFDRLMKRADDEHVAGEKAAIEKYGSRKAWSDAVLKDEDKEFHSFLGYDKVKFTLNMPDGTKYTERQDIGDGYGGVIDFLSQYPKYREIIPILEQARVATETNSFRRLKARYSNIKGQLDELKNEVTEQQTTSTDDIRVSPVTQLSGDVISDFREKTDEYYNKLTGYSAHDVEELVKYFIRGVIRENELSADVGEVVLYGSRSRGMENENSDLDFVAEIYSDDLKEDALFNILHETPYEVGGVTVDINPIRAEESGSLEDYLVGAERYLQQKGAKENNAPEVQNYRVEEIEQTSFGQKTRYAANVAAIKTLNQIESENRTATPDEQKILAQYVGWGGIPSVFDSDNTSWAAEYEELKELLTPDEYEAARSTVLTAHYTSPTIISAVYSALDKFGFKGGNVLEPSMGIGNFFGVMPEEMRSESSLHGVELDDISGRIAKQLYPNADIQICGYENTAFSDNFFDAAVGNVPFGNYSIADTRYDREHFLIHDYFFAKTLDKVAPGGVVAFITSKGTLDKTTPKVREYLAKRADLIGAIRLPDNAFKANAGTEVTADIIFLQKREKMSVEKPDWCYTAEIAEGISVNQYFIDHPEMILGEMKLVSGRYGYETACVPIEGADLKEQLNGAVMRLSRDIITTRREDKRNEEHGIIPATADVRNFTFTEVNDKIYFRENNIMREIPFSKRNHERMRGMIGIRNTFRALVDAQSEGCSDETLSGLQFRLNAEYDAFVMNFGHISDIENRKVFAVDDDYNTLCGALELIDPETKTVTKADIFTKRTIKPYVEVTHVDTPQEALFVSLDMRGFADIGYMAELCGTPNEEVIRELTEGGFIYKNPETAKYEEAAEYLSGYVREKLRKAQDATAENPEYERNVAALEKALPPKLGAGDISVRLGAPWITIADYCKFFKEYAQGVVSEGSYYARDTVLYRSVSGEYKIENKNADKSVAAQSSFGTKRMNSYAIFENLLNNRDIAVYDSFETPDGKKKRVMNKDETQLAQEKARQMKEAFPKWLWSDPERREKYVEIYNELFNSLVGREYDGSHQTFPGMNPFIELNEHQKNAVMRAKLGGNTLLAHCVGAGKTFEMAAAVMEKRRLGLINKACIVVPKHLVGQMSAEWLRLYPEARLLTAKENDFNDVNRQKFIGRCCTGDYDAVIMSYQQFQKIPMSFEYQREFLSDQLKSLTNQLRDYNGYLSADDKRSVKDLERMKKNIETKLNRLLDTPHDNSLNFEQLGFDCIVADEAHNYKNGLVVTKMKNVSGIGSRAAKKSEDFLMKTRYLNEKFGERNLILASGTPVSNSMTELYIMQQYLRPSALLRQGLQNFDDWASTFGEVVSQLELKPAGAEQT